MRFKANKVGQKIKIISYEPYEYKVWWVGGICTYHINLN